MMIKDEELLHMLLGELENAEIGRRWYVAMAIAKMGPPALDPLMDIVRNGSVAKVAAMWAISEIGNKKAVPVLVDELHSGEDEFHRAMAASALMKIDDPEGVAQVKLALSEGKDMFAELFREVYNR
ncbi:MAG: HEAT repeat domain-containing protein [Methanomicrobiaceae archaeon]|nr:HEAT repeat domain-containing protein [Methanomicrobiaceae archaeon]